jgi:type II secretory pathway pseudopilin PulG
LPAYASDAKSAGRVVSKSGKETTMNIKQRKRAGAFTLIEVMAAILIVIILITGSSFLFIMGKNQVNIQKRYRAASQLAAQKLEELKATSYASVICGNEDITLEDITYSRDTNVIDVNSLYKEVTVTVGWQQGNNERSISMVTCIAP